MYSEFEEIPMSCLAGLGQVGFIFGKLCLSGVLEGDSTDINKSELKSEKAIVKCLTDSYFFENNSRRIPKKLKQYLPKTQASLLKTQ